MADFYDELPTHPADAEAAAGCLADLAAGGPALELGIGTGRLALPLAGPGVPVRGVGAKAGLPGRRLGETARAATAAAARPLPPHRLAGRPPPHLSRLPHH